MGSRWRSLFRPVRHVDGVVEPRVKGRRGCRIPWWPRITLKHVPGERPAIASHPAPGIELRQIEQLVTLTGQRILEIGCGAGRSHAAVRPARVLSNWRRLGPGSNRQSQTSSHCSRD